MMVIKNHLCVDSWAFNVWPAVAKIYGVNFSFHQWTFVYKLPRLCSEFEYYFE